MRTVNSLGYPTGATRRVVTAAPPSAPAASAAPSRSACTVDRVVSLVGLGLHVVCTTMLGILLWRIEHVHIHVAEVVAKVYDCAGAPLNTSVCSVTEHL